MTPFQVFPTKDGYVAVALRGGIKDQWPLYCAAIDRIDLIDDPRFETGWLRTQNYNILEPIFNEAMKKKTTREWVEELEQMAIPCGPMNTVDQLAADPYVEARDMIIDVHHPTAGDFKVVNTPFKFSRTPYKVDKASPELGEHTEQVLSQLLNMTDDEINELKGSGIV